MEMTIELTKQEKRLGRLLMLLTVFFGLALVANVAAPIAVRSLRESLQNAYPFVVNSSAKMAALTLLALNGFISVRRNVELIKILIWVHGISVVVLLLFALFGQAPPNIQTLLWAGVALDAALGTVILVLFTMAIRSRTMLQPQTGFNALRTFLADAGGFLRVRAEPLLLSDIQTDALANLIDAVIPPPGERRVEPAHLVKRFEEFISVVDAVPKELLKTALDVIAPIVAVKALKSDESSRVTLRREMQKALESEDERKQNAARLLHILITYLYYSDPAVDSQVGYTRFRARSRPEAQTAPGKSRLRVLNAVPLQKTYDVCIVGSGVAGSILANRLAKQGKSVLVLDAGRYYPEGAITDDEFLMLAHLYKADIFQAAVGDTFPVIQAKCVGGGAVVNNAVCFRLPDWVRREWANLGAELDTGRFQAAFDKLETELKIRPADQVFGQAGRTYLNPAREFFLQGVQKLGLNHGTGSPREVYEGFYTVAVNVENCLGCGYCNLGCAYERKVNTLKALLPDAIRTGNCDVVQMAHVDSVSFEWLAQDRLKATSLRVKLGTGERINVSARKFILSAGAIGSSEILLRSPELKVLGLPVGKYFSANAGSPVHARFNTLVNAYDGLQISDYYLEKNGRGEWDWIAETWYNPPATQSQGIPGYLDTHFERMKQYPYYAAIGPLVGTEAVGEINLTYLNQTQVKLRLPDSDIAKLKKAIHRCSEIYLEAGAEEILLITNPELVLKSKDDLAKIQRQIQTHDDFLVLSSGHPMGGNRMSDARSNGKPAGVVGTNFKVHGVEDLFVCDASVFPTSAKVNPQWTVMALAELCAEEIVGEL